ncbi:uncharacterized protein LOC125778437 [Bactrocera dorsalis]|uniref:Uncharacterized protein LOC125778437 n=1 Tax=Bactrocera dorsalis TaxID=27457 RepID=A0ABM3JRT6_BACDO|nr:uncharacterized protein LOC125778437 [Bactrocera dorsalis]
MDTNKTNNNNNNNKDLRQQKRRTDTDNEKETDAALGKSGRGARRKVNFMDILSPDERELFVEHAKEDSDDTPSCSCAHLAKRPAAAAAATSTAKTPAVRRSGSDSEESHRAEPDGARRRRRRRRRGGQRPLPEAGKPGGCDDPKRRGMSGAIMRWYLRYLREGKTPEAAEAMARSRGKGSSAPPAKERVNTGSARAEGSGTSNRPVGATLTARRGDGRAMPSETYAQTAKRSSGQITPQEPPSSKRSRGNGNKETGSQQSEPAPHRVEEGRRRYADAVKGLRMAVLPLNYPAEALKPEELTELQNLLLDEVFRGETFAASFLGVEFKGGMLQVECKNERSANWLREFAPKLGGWKGPALCARRAEDLPVMHSMTMFLPRSDDKPYEYALGLVKNQNLGLSISSWRVASSKMEEIGGMKGWRLNLYIDDESYKYVRAEGFRLYYRFSTVIMRPHRSAATGSKGAAMPAKQEGESIEKQAASLAAPEAVPMQVDEVADQPCESGTERAVPATTTDVPVEDHCDQGAQLPSTQELLDGLGDPLDGGDIDGGEEGVPFLEPVL